ncbi:MAG: hypothetical protein IJ864_03125 [Alphaproteobacteria bacterium]|nr:hypothetical protein [Alphaproteobacteria bacterium]
MKKLKNFFRFCTISTITLVLLTIVARFIFRMIWHFDILDKHSYQLMAEYWNSGGIFNSLQDYSLGLMFLSLPIIWLWISYKTYRFGLMRLLSLPITKIYRYLTRPETYDVEHVKIKNLRGKEKNIEELIAEKIKEENPNSGAAHTVKNLRAQISARIGENKKQ